MASLATVSREVARLSSQSIRRNVYSRGFRNHSRVFAAQNLTMPAMSPTMTAGNIASWKVKEGDSFSTGDVLLEIETDKAQMDVEAQDDGKMAKITQQDGSKGVKVGTRIAVLAESDDDLSTLELPAEEPSPQASPQKDLKSGVDPSIPSESHAEAPSISKGEDASPANPSELSSSSPSSNSKPQKQTYPLYPSIAQLLHEKGLPTSEAEKIPASGPKGRLLKGDVLAYLGTIKQSYSSDQSARISKLGHLDLSNVKAAPPKESTSPPSKAPSPMAAESEPDTEIAIPISLSSVLSVQKRIQGTLGVTLPLSTFIARATELANDELPRSATSKPSADELFNDVLGLHNISAASSQGHFIPQITALPSRPMTERPAGPSRQPDVYDILTGHASATSRSKRIAMPPPGIMAGSKPGESTNVFSVSAAKGEEKRARVFLERVKTILQVEPGRLIL